MDNNICPDCGEPITLNKSGWWSHDGMPNGCWRLSLDGPNNDEPADDHNPPPVTIEDFIDPASKDKPVDHPF